MAKVARHMPPMRSHPHEKNFFVDLQRLQKLWNETGECLIFFSNWLIPFWNSLLIICRTASFDVTDNLPIEFLGCTALKWHATAEPTQRPHILAARCNFCCADLPRCATRIVWTYLYSIRKQKTVCLQLTASGWTKLNLRLHYATWHSTARPHIKSHTMPLVYVDVVSA